MQYRAFTNREIEAVAFPAEISDSHTQDDRYQAYVSNLEEQCQRANALDTAVACAMSRMHSSHKMHQELTAASNYYKGINQNPSGVKTPVIAHEAPAEEIMPRWRWEELRVQALLEAATGRVDTGASVGEWAREIHELLTAREYRLERLVREKNLDSVSRNADGDKSDAPVTGR